MIFLGIDCGTQSTKTLALDWETGAVLASGQHSYGFVPGLPSGAMEQFAGSEDLTGICARSVGLDASTRVGPDTTNVRCSAELLAKTSGLRGVLHENHLI